MLSPTNGFNPTIPDIHETLENRMKQLRQSRLQVTNNKVAKKRQIERSGIQQLLLTVPKT